MRTKYAPLVYVVQGMSIMMFLLLVGCTLLTPNYKKPLLNIPKKWHSYDQKSRILPIKINSLAWWEKYHDPQLNQLIADALTHNNDLGIATGNILQAQASLRRVQYKWLPRLDLGTFAYTAHFSESINRNSSTPARNFDNAFVGFVPNYSLNIMHQIKNQEVAKLNLALQEISQNAVRLGLISQISGSYFSLLGLKQQLALQQQLIKDAKILRNYLNIQYKNGSVSQLKLANVDQLLASLQEKIPLIQHDITQTQNAIRALTNKNPGMVITHNHFAQINPEVIVPINLPAEALTARPDIAMAEYQLRISHSMIGVETAKLFPTLGVAGFLGTAALGNAFTIGQMIASMPLIALTTYADIAEAKGKEYAVYYQYVKTVRNALVEIDDALSQHNAILQSYQHHLQELVEAKKQYQIAQQQYQQGSISYTATILYKLNVDYTEARLNECKMQQMKSMVTLYQAFGGGYLKC